MMTVDHLVNEFARSMTGRDPAEVIVLADREATRAHRIALRSCRESRPRSNAWCEYSRALIRLVFFLRHEVKPGKIDRHMLTLLGSMPDCTGTQRPLRPASAAGRLSTV